MAFSPHRGPCRKAARRELIDVPRYPDGQRRAKCGDKRAEVRPNFN
jgi:hypothetical protein